MKLTNSQQNIRQILATDTLLIDVRAPIEFNQGSMPAAHNLPLMNDEERSAVGTCYKKQGSLKAVELGHQLVRGTIRDIRMAAWRDICMQNPQGYICCARGGMRSHIVQQWFQETGINYPLVIGGYKAMRQTIIESTEELLQRPTVLIGGCTGNGKTTLVRQLPDGIDLEGIAHHRGSSFGRTLQPQFSQATFENHLGVQLLKKSSHTIRWVFEDESKAIGANSLPEPLRHKMATASLVVVDDPFEQRLQRLKYEYFDNMARDFLGSYGEEQGWLAYSEYLHHGLSAIRRRLGSQRASELIALLDMALIEQKKTGSTEAHFTWLYPLLNEYYDPMYNYQLSKKQERIVFRGNYAEVFEWLTT